MGPEEGTWRHQTPAQPSTEELWWYPWADTRAEPGATELDREDLQQLLFTTSQGVTHLVVILREDSGMGGEAPRAAVQAIKTRH